VVANPGGKPSASQMAPAKPDCANAPETSPAEAPASPNVASQPALPAPEATATNPPTPSASEEATPLAPPAPPANGAGYLVQVAAVSKQQDAEALVEALRKKQYPVFLASHNADTLFHVQIGPFSDLQQAEGVRSRLLADGYNPIVKK